MKEKINKNENIKELHKKTKHLNNKSEILIDEPKNDEEKRENFIKYITLLYKNLSNAMQSIEELLLKVEDNELKKELSNQLTEFDLIARECEMIAKSEKINLKDNNLFEKLMLWSSLNLNTIADKRASHIAEIMIFGTISSLTQCLKAINDYKNTCTELDDICNRIINLEEKNYQNLKKFI